MRHPVILMHGFGVLLNHYLPHHLELVKRIFDKEGIDVLLPQISPYNPPQIRVLEWKRWILEHVEGSFHLIAHSQGGLEAVLLTMDPEMHDRILSVQTVATPFGGTIVPKLFKIAPPPIKRKIYKEMENAALRFYPHAEARAIQSMEALKIPPALVKPETIPIFSYFCSISKRAAHQLPFPFWIPFLLLSLKAGKSDGLVTEKSQQFGTARGPFALNHAEQLGIFVRNKNKSEYFRLWDTIISDLRATENAAV